MPSCIHFVAYHTYLVLFALHTKQTNLSDLARNNVKYFAILFEMNKQLLTKLDETMAQIVEYKMEHNARLIDKVLQNKRKADNALFKKTNADNNKMEKERKKAKGAATTGQKQSKEVRLLILTDGKMLCHPQLKKTPLSKDKR